MNTSIHPLARVRLNISANHGMLVSGLEHPDRDKQETSIGVDGSAEAPWSPWRAS